MWEFDPAYTNYIKSDLWKRTCQKYWAVYGRKCQACGTKQGSLHVHHKTYDRLGREKLTDLCGLCHDCHRKVHEIHRRNRKLSLLLVTDSYVKQRRTNGR